MEGSGTIGEASAEKSTSGSEPEREAGRGGQQEGRSHITRPLALRPPPSHGGDATSRARQRHRRTQNDAASKEDGKEKILHGARP